jgi:hypothetical protein
LLDHAGGNVTGVSILSTEADRKAVGAFACPGAECDSHSSQLMQHITLVTSAQSSLSMIHRRFRKVPGLVIAVVSSIVSLAALAQRTPVEYPINSVREIRAGLRRCWVPPRRECPRNSPFVLALSATEKFLDSRSSAIQVQTLLRTSGLHSMQQLSQPWPTALLCQSVLRSVL